MEIKNVNVLNYGLKKEFLDRYDVNEVLERNHLKPELIIEDIKKITTISDIRVYYEIM